MLALVLASLLIPAFGGPANAEILNDDEFGYLEIMDLTVIEDAAQMYLPNGLSINMTRGTYFVPGNEVCINYRGLNDHYVTVLDYSPDRVVKPLVMNEHLTLLNTGLQREYYGTIGDSLGHEYILMLVSDLPFTDEELEAIALAPNEIEIGEKVMMVGVSDFYVNSPGRDPDTVVNWGRGLTGDIPGGQFIDLDEFAIYLDYPLNSYPYNPWPYMYLYPYPRLNSQVYYSQMGPFSNTWYVIPGTQSLTSNFWDYANDSWIDDGLWIIPPGGYWQGTFNMDDPYAYYYLRVLPYLVRENTSYLNLQIEINGTLVQPSIDATGAIGWGEYWTEDPFAYYNLSTLLHQGDNEISLYWPEWENENLQLQMMDIVPEEDATGVLMIETGTSL